ncbi:MAG: hypothetical protein JXA74_05105 [Anaerolineae bacterium]|nr:hypothetical protein [Anaerolineae bacterium]
MNASQHDEHLESLRRDLADPRSGVRRAALGRIAPKGRGGTQALLDDPRVVSLLVTALADPDRRVERAAARALRPWVRRDPELLGQILPAYAGQAYDGGYTHAGLYDTVTGLIWIPRFAALKGHAALLADGDTDRYYKFAFYVPGQAPPRLSEAAPERPCGHLVLHHILDWSYAHQGWIPLWDDRRLALSRRQQERYGSHVRRFYQRCGLPFPVCVHRRLMMTGEPPRYELCVATLEAHSPSGPGAG